MTTNPSNSDLVGEAKPDLDAFEHLLQVGDCPYLGELEKLVRYTREVAQQLEQADAEIEEWKIEAERGKWPKEKAQAFFRYREALQQIAYSHDASSVKSDRARAALTPDEGADPGGR